MQDELSYTLNMQKTNQWQVRENKRSGDLIRFVSF